MLAHKFQGHTHLKKNFYVYTRYLSFYTTNVEIDTSIDTYTNTDAVPNPAEGGGQRQGAPAFLWCTHTHTKP